MVHTGTPACLTKLSITYDDWNCVPLICTFTSMFEAGGLHVMTDLKLAVYVNANSCCKS